MTVEAEGPLGSVFSPEIETALASLTAGEREVIALRIVLDFDAEHVARLLRISRSACSMRLARAGRAFHGNRSEPACTSRAPRVAPPAEIPSPTGG
jgi:DNA-directed RNA polymerase specialized sigma24 family protein